MFTSPSDPTTNGLQLKTQYQHGEIRIDKCTFKNFDQALSVESEIQALVFNVTNSKFYKNLIGVQISEHAAVEVNKCSFLGMLAAE